MVKLYQMHYCDHMMQLTPPKTLPNKSAKIACEACHTLAPQVWVCLSKGCGYVACELNKLKHMFQHQQQSKKKSHCLFINPHNAEIRCIECKIEIYDFEHLGEQVKTYGATIDPLQFREKYLPKTPLSTSVTINVTTLENSEAHKKSGKGLCGIFGKSSILAVSSVIQYYSNIPYYKHILKHCKLDPERSQNEKFVWELAQIVKKLWSGGSKVTAVDEFLQTIYKSIPKLRGYRRKDPFEVFSLILNNLHDEFKYYETLQVPMETTANQELLQDEWAILRNSRNMYKQYSPITGPLSTQIKYRLVCPKCKAESRSHGQIMGLKLQIPKSKRVSKQISKEFEKHRYESPPKKERRLSLFDRVFGSSEQQMEITILELMFNFMKVLEPTADTNRNCQECRQVMVKQEAKFVRLPRILFIQVPRLSKDRYTTSTTPVDYPLTSLDLSGFVETGYQGQTVFEFVSAICITNESEYVTVSRNSKNKQLYQYKNESCRIITKSTHAPYMLCYSIRNRHKSLYHNIKSNVEIQILPEYPLPDFWLEQLKNFEPGPLLNQRICKHHNCKPRFESKCTRTNYIPREIYEALLEKFGGRMFNNKECEHCFKQLAALTKRKKLEKEFVTKLDKYSCSQHCMISCFWLNKWTKYLYAKKEVNYFVKRAPPPGPINNSVLLESQSKCKPGLKKGEDYRIVNYYVWLFFKQLYSGGPEIQYKTKQQPKEAVLDTEVFTEIENMVLELKQYLQPEYYLSKDWEQSPQKLTKRKSSSSLSESELFRGRDSFHQ